MSNSASKTATTSAARAQLYAATKLKPTAFQQKVYAATAAIPEGFVSTYGAVAAAVGCTASRPVGGALRRNSWAPGIPCHRVVATDRKLGGFNGSWGESTPDVCRKKDILEAEGVVFDEGGRVSTECIHSVEGFKLSYADLTLAALDTTASQPAAAAAAAAAAAGAGAAGRGGGGSAAVGERGEEKRAWRGKSTGGRKRPTTRNPKQTNSTQGKKKAGKAARAARGSAD
eukprot:gene13929-15342_t